MPKFTPKRGAEITKPKPNARRQRRQAEAESRKATKKAQKEYEKTLAKYPTPTKSKPTPVQMQWREKKSSKAIIREQAKRIAELEAQVKALKKSA